MCMSVCTYSSMCMSVCTYSSMCMSVCTYSSMCIICTYSSMCIICTSFSLILLLLMLTAHFQLILFIVVALLGHSSITTKHHLLNTKCYKYILTLFSRLSSN